MLKVNCVIIPVTAQELIGIRTGAIQRAADGSYTIGNIKISKDGQISAVSGSIPLEHGLKQKLTICHTIEAMKNKFKDYCDQGKRFVVVNAINLLAAIHTAKEDMVQKLTSSWKGMTQQMKDAARCSKQSDKVKASHFWKELEKTKGVEAFKNWWHIVKSNDLEVVLNYILNKGVYGAEYKVIWRDMCQEIVDKIYEELGGSQNLHEVSKWLDKVLEKIPGGDKLAFKKRMLEAYFRRNCQERCVTNMDFDDFINTVEHGAQDFMKSVEHLPTTLLETLYDELYKKYGEQETVPQNAKEFLDAIVKELGNRTEKKVAAPVNKALKNLSEELEKLKETLNDDEHDNIRSRIDSLLSEIKKLQEQINKGGFIYGGYQQLCEKVSDLYKELYVKGDIVKDKVKAEAIKAAKEVADEYDKLKKEAKEQIKKLQKQIKDKLVKELQTHASDQNIKEFLAKVQNMKDSKEALKELFKKLQKEAQRDEKLREKLETITKDFLDGMSSIATNNLFLQDAKAAVRDTAFNALIAIAEKGGDIAPEVIGALSTEKRMMLYKVLLTNAFKRLYKVHSDNQYKNNPDNNAGMDIYDLLFGAYPGTRLADSGGVVFNDDLLSEVKEYPGLLDIIANIGSPNQNVEYIEDAVSVMDLQMARLEQSFYNSGLTEAEQKEINQAKRLIGIIVKYQEYQLEHANDTVDDKHASPDFRNGTPKSG